MEHIRFNFDCVVLRKTIDGFVAILEDGYIVKFRDIKYHYFFEVGDLLGITIENTDHNSNDEVKKNYVIIYVILNSFLSNCILFRDINEKKWFWSKRGMISHRTFEKNDYWEEGTLLKIIIKKE